MKPHRPDLILIFTTFVLVGLGLVMVFSASSVEATLMHNDPYHFFVRQSMWAGIGFVVFFVVMFAPISWIRWWSPIGFIISVVLLGLVPFIGTTLGMGAQRWLEFGPITIMPSEVAKPFLVLMLALILERLGPRIRQFKWLFLAAIPLAIVAFLVLIQPDLGTSIVIIGCYGVMLLIGGMKKRIASLVVLLGGGVLTAIVLFTDYQKERITAWLDPWSDPLETGWQIIQSMYAIGSGGLLGLKLGHSRQKYGYLPEPMTDFIFAIIAEELGFVGAMFVIVLFVIFLWRGYRIALTAPDTFTSIAAAGITTMITLQAFINIAVVTSTLPNTGIPLPFISNGGTSLLITLFSTGILLNISRYTRSS